MAILLLIGPAHLNAAEAPVQFGRDILPILSDNCFQCHGPDEKARKAKLRFDTKEGAFRIKDGTAPIVGGHSDQSALFRRISSADPDEVMPPPKSNRRLSAQQIQMLKRWIDAGAVWGEHWSFEKIRRPLPPAIGALSNRVINPIDQFIFARLQKEKLSPASQAPRETLIRRLSLDLTGLPSTPAQVDAFVADKSTQAYEKLVDRLLESPAFGERMAWDWLDAARYADSNGYQGDSDRTMWPWRDWVVKAFNQNLRYDRFTILQLAGDLLPNAGIEEKLPTGFCRNHMINGEGGRIAEENRVEYVMDMSETVGTVWLGLTFNCCRCHDHKFDALTKRDYYSLFAFFNQTPVNGGGGDPQSEPNIELITATEESKLASLESQIEDTARTIDEMEKTVFASAEDKPIADSEKAKAAEKKIQDILKRTAARRSSSQLSNLESAFEKTDPDYVKKLKALGTLLNDRERVTRSITRVMVMEDMPKPRKTFMLDKGIYDKHGDEIAAALPAKLIASEISTATNRLELARWLVSPTNPLTARVTVNRFWQQFFGIGLVKTPEDFGVQGERPVHPELLDWLASEFIDSGWDVKHLCKLMVMSAAYRQSSKATPQQIELDPENRLLSRGARFRMPSWMIRDQALAACGLLVDVKGGKSVKPYQPGGVWEDATFGNRKYQQDKGAALYRRSLYTFWRRIIAPTMFFDNASRQICTVKKSRTNTPLQALITLNDDTYVEAARTLAEKVLTTGKPAIDDRIDFAFRRLLSRRATADEKRILRGTLQRLLGEFRDDPESAKKFLTVGDSKSNPKLDSIEHAAYTGMCLALLNMDETLTKE